jgi:ribonuclease P protein component
LLVFDRKDDDPSIRLGITITKKVGNAVIRNRMRRRFRSLMREMLADKGKPGADHILIGRQDGIEMDFNLLRSDLQKAFDRVAV